MLEVEKAGALRQAKKQRFGGLLKSAAFILTENRGSQIRAFLPRIPLSINGLRLQSAPGRPERKPALSYERDVFFGPATLCGRESYKGRLPNAPQNHVKMHFSSKKAY